MSKAACKEIIDSGGGNRAAALTYAATTQTQATSLDIFGVADAPAGDKWLDDVQKHQKKAADAFAKLNAEAMELCMSQPIA